METSQARASTVSAWTARSVVAGPVRMTTALSTRRARSFVRGSSLLAVVPGAV